MAGKPVGHQADAGSCVALTAGRPGRAARPLDIART